MRMMNLFVLVLVLSCLVNLAAEIPQNIRATAISHDGFTLRWDHVDGADEYAVEVKATDYTDLFVGFEDDSPMPSGWSLGGQASVSSYSTLAYAGDSFLTVSVLGAYILSTKIFNLQSISFYAKTTYSPPADFIAVLQTSIDAQTWQDVEPAITQDTITNTYVEHIYDLSDYTGEHFLRIYLKERASGMNLLIDNISITAVFPDGLDNLTPGEVSHHGLRIDNLDSETEYIYRVKTNSDKGDFSAWKVLTTLPENPSQNTGSAIAGSSPTIPVSIGEAAHSITIDPSSAGIDADYSVSLSQDDSAFLYDIECADSSALNGIYTISHPGCLAQTASVQGAGSYTVDTSVDYETTLEISGISAKGNLSITLTPEDSTLPVMLSSFTARVVSANACRVEWSSQSESNLLGYYVLRGRDHLAASAELISALIPACNSSSTQRYSFLDHAAEYPVYYWLMSVEIDGSDTIYGPVFADFQSEQTQAMVEYRDDVSIFPNPLSHEATMQISVACDQQIGFKLYNLKGQLLRSEEIGWLKKGRHQIPFSAKDSQGKSLSTGIYLLDLKYGNSSIREKILITK